MLIEAMASRALPNPNADGQGGYIRSARRGELLVSHLVPNFNGLADEGSYFVATNPTIGTGIAFGAAAGTAFSDTGAGLAIANSAEAGSGTRVYLDYIKLLLTALPSGTIASPFAQYAFRVDNVATRYTSGGTSITPVCPNEDFSGETAGVSLYFGNLVVAAGSSAAETVGRGCMRSIAEVVNDQFLFCFGAVEKNAGGQSLALSTAGLFQFNLPPVCIGPGGVFTMHQWQGGQTAAPTFEFEIGLFVR